MTATLAQTSQSAPSRATVAPDPSTITPPLTPNATSVAAHELFSEVQAVCDILSALPSLAPGQQINALLTRLVKLCTKPSDPTFSSYFFNIPGAENLCSRLRPLLSEAEGELESHWAKRMLETLSCLTRTPLANHDLLKTFPYHQNYVDLSRLECSVVEAFLPTPPRVAVFIGSGPLPLTSLCFLDRYPTATVHNIDRDVSALRISQELCNRLGYGGRMSFACEDASTEKHRQTDWTSFQVVFLAALVGIDTFAKLAILSSLRQRLRPGTLVVARSAHGLRRVLYPVLELSDELDRIGFGILAEVHPWSEVVNSVIVLRVRDR